MQIGRQRPGGAADRDCDADRLCEADRLSDDADGLLGIYRHGPVIRSAGSRRWRLGRNVAKNLLHRHPLGHSFPVGQVGEQDVPFSYVALDLRQRVGPKLLAIARDVVVHRILLKTM